MTKDADYILSKNESSLQNAYGMVPVLLKKQKNKKKTEYLNMGRKDHKYISQILSDLSLSYG